MLPHVGVGEYCETKKAYYFGYVSSHSGAFALNFLGEFSVINELLLFLNQIYHSSTPAMRPWSKG